MKRTGLEAYRDERLAATVEKRVRLAEQQRELREYYKSRGICIRCHRNEAQPGRVLCRECRLYTNQARSGYVEHTRKYLEKERKAGRL